MTWVGYITYFLLFVGFVLYHLVLVVPMREMCVVERLGKFRGVLEPGLHFLGLMTYPPRNRVAEVDQWLEDARQLLTENHLAPEVISSGGTPNY